MGEGREVGGHPPAVSFAGLLASDESRMRTGTTIAADGGRSSCLRFETRDD
jgi:hypothetical protein